MSEFTRSALSVLAAIWAVAGLVSTVPALMSPMLFDAPGATSDRALIAIACGLLLMPVVCLISFGGFFLTLSMNRLDVSFALLSLPLINMTVIVVAFWLAK